LEAIHEKSIIEVIEDLLKSWSIGEVFLIECVWRELIGSSSSFDLRTRTWRKEMVPTKKENNNNLYSYFSDWELLSHYGSAKMYYM